MTIRVAPDGEAKVLGWKRVGRVLPVYALEFGTRADLMAGHDAGLRRVGVGEVDGMLCTLWAYAGVGYVATKIALRVRDTAEWLWRRLRYTPRRTRRAVGDWWRDVAGYNGW